jgi:hypothetical protein
MKSVNIYYIASVLFLLLMLISCNGRKAKVESNQLLSHSNKYDVVYSDENTPLWGVAAMEVVDNILILNHRGKFGFSFIDIQRGTLIRQWGELGDAPYQYADMSYFSLLDSLLFFSDHNKKEMVYAPLNEIISQGLLAHTNKFEYPYTRECRFLCFCPIRSDVIIGLGGLEKGRFGVLNGNYEIMDCLFDYPYPTDGIEGIYRGVTYQSLIKASPDKNRFVISTLLSDAFEIYEVKNDRTIHSVYTSPIKHQPKAIHEGYHYALDVNKNIAGITQLAVNEENIFLLYSEASARKVVLNDFAVDIIKCYDWDGNYIKTIKLPFPISTFCVDDSSIYAVKYEEDDTIICRFALDINVSST